MRTLAAFPEQIPPSAPSLSLDNRLSSTRSPYEQSTRISLVAGVQIVNRTRNGESVTRLHLELTSSARQRLEKLRATTQADSLSEVLRRSLIIYEFLCLERSNGSRIVVKDSTSEREVVLL